MNKQYMKYVGRHIIFTIVVWLIVCVSVVGASYIDVYCDEYGFYTSSDPDNDCTRFHWDNVSHAADCQATHRVCIYDYYSGSVQAGLFIEGGVFEYSSAIDINGACVDINRTYTSIGTKEICCCRYMNAYSGSTSWRSYAIYYPSGDNYNIGGTTKCVGNVSLYIYDTTTQTWIVMNEKELTYDGDSYNFNIINSLTYKIAFDVYEYEFIVNNTNINYDCDLCGYQILHYVDNCGNFLKNPTINIIKNDDYANPLIDNGNSYTDIFMIGEDIDTNDKLDIWIGTDQGEQFRTIYAGISENYLYHSYKSWDLDVTVYDINTTAYISGAKVSIKQDCRINEYPLHTFGTTNMYGYVKTYDLSNQVYQVKVEKDNYTTFGYQTINAGFDAQHTNIPLTIYLQDPTKGSGNGSIGEPPTDGTGGDDEEPLPQTPCSIMWADDDGKSITEINDTQDARLYFMAPNCSATLYLESRDSDNHVWVFETSLPVTALQAGYAQYVSTDWTYSETKRYRGRLWADDCMCDATDDLKVWDASDANITIVNNLSANVHFRHKVGGTYINPTTPIHILSTASSNNTTLLNINLQLFNSTVKVDEISYTFFDYYTTGSFSPIQWNPNYEYSAGCLYCVYMYSNDILVNFDSVYANATDDNYFDTGNALTIKVYDQGLTPLAYSSVYIEGWGTEDTGNSNQVIFSGLGNDEYQYRAIKSGYLDRGFYAITLAGDDTVNYVLDIISSEHSVTDLRMSDHDIKTMMYPIIFFILIMLLIGVLIDAIN